MRMASIQRHPRDLRAGQVYTGVIPELETTAWKQDDARDGGGRVTPGAVAYMDVGKEREHDCMDAGGRTNQETESRSPNAVAARMA